ncbi:MAG: glycoside hydrolase family 130 protein [Deltaproteobacteria bacterium]|nr:glycoside hydrolase family 130 protein [Deltaproteobacteria bacterium]
MPLTINTAAVTNIPWQERSAENNDVIWRYSGNPIVPRAPFSGANSVFNSAVIAHDGKFVGIFRVDDQQRIMNLHYGESADGIKWSINEKPIEFVGAKPEIAEFIYRYDPRLVWIEDRYYLTWCNGYHGPTIGIAYTFNFETFHQLENSFLPFNRNGVLFPRKINGKYVMLSRPSDDSHTSFGDIFLSHSIDMIHWGEHRHVMGTTHRWCHTKVGAGPIPIETNEGWLLIFHGVLTSCNGFIYSMGAALLDLENPWIVRYRAAPYLMSPQTIYECVGDVPNVVFPCAAIVDGPTGRMAIYYGAADTVVGLAFAYVDEIIKWVKANVA